MSTIETVNGAAAQAAATQSAKVLAFLNLEARKNAITSNNKQNAVDLAREGIPVFICNTETKAPYPIAWEREDVNIPPEEREALRRAFVDKHGFEPQHIGSTRDTKLIRKWFREKPEAVPAVSCGPAGLTVIDNDIKVRDGVLRNGVELFDAFCEPHGGIPEGVIAISTQGKGRHLYFKADDVEPLGCSAGTLKKDCESDVKAFGGYCIAPGTIRRHDGRRYGSSADLKAFLKAYREKRLVPVPQFIRDAIGTKPEGAADKVTAAQWAQPLKDLAEKTWPEYADTFGEPALGAKYSFVALMQKDPELREVMESPTGNRSDDRWKIARRLSFLCPDMLVEELAVFYAEHADIAGDLTDDGNGQGNYSHTDIAKEWAKNRIAVEKGEVKTPSSTGEGFEAVEDESEEDDAPVSAEVQAKWDAEAKKREDKAARLKAEREAQAEIVRLKAEIAGLDKAADAKKIEEPKAKGPRIQRSMDIFENFEPADELIEGLLPAVGTVCIFADSNTGKTCFAIDMLDKVMKGDKFYGRNTERGGVLLVAGEGRVGLNKRLAALHQERPCLDGRGISVSYELPSFPNEAAIELEILKLESLIKSTEKQSGETTRLVVLDNLIAMVGGGDVNTSKDTRPIFKALDDLALKLKICICVIHHENRSGTTAGSFAIRASVDVMLQITEEKKTGLRTFFGDKARDDPRSQKMQFRLKPVIVGENKWGNPVSSCVVEPVLSGEAMDAVEDGEEVPQLKISDDRDDRVTRLLEAVRECAEKAAAHGQPLDDVALAPKEIGVAVNILRGRFCGLNGKPLAPLNREGVNRIIARALEEGKMVLRKAKYHLVED